MPGVRIGDGATIGALSPIRRDLEPFVIAVGNLLCMLRRRDRVRLEDLERRLAERESRQR